MSERELLAWAALAPEEREGRSDTPLGDCPECDAPHGTYDAECPSCFAVWLADPDDPLAER